MEKMQEAENNQVRATSLMPQDEDALHILHSRAQQFAISNTKQDSTQNDGVKYICFSLGNTHERYGIPYHYATEVISNVKPSKLPKAPKHIAGVINRRGNLIAVIDLKYFFHTNLPDSNKNTYIIVITAKDTTIGILADNIEGSYVYEPSQLDPPFTFLDLIKPELIIGLHQGVTAIINVEALISAPELQVKK